MSGIIIGMTPDVASVYNSMIEAGIDGDLVLIQLTRMVPVEVIEIEDEELQEEAQDIGEAPESIEPVAQDVEKATESISQN